MKNSFVFYETYYEALKELPDDVQLAFFHYIAEYALYENEPELTGIEKALWIQIKQGLDKSKDRYDRLVENGKKGGRPVENQEKPNETKENQSITKENQSITKENQSITKESSRFQKPTLEEVSEYCKERQNNIQPQRFIDFYESKGWKVGSQPMKDWKAAVRTWEQRSQTPPGNFYTSPPRTLPDDKLTF